MINCYVVVSKGTREPNSKLALQGGAVISAIVMKGLPNPTIWVTTLDQKLARRLAKEIGGRVCRLVEDVE